MKKLIVLALLVVFAPAAFSQGMVKKKAVESAATPATPAPTPAKVAPKAAAKAPAKGKGWTGTVCTLQGCASGKCTNLTKADAQKSASRGEILVFCVGKKAYVVVNADGTNASSKLADHAGDKVSVSGKMMSKGGMSVIMADSIN